MCGLAVDEQPAGVRFWVQASPGARSSSIVGLHGDALRVKLSAPPVDGKANAELVKVLSAALGVPVELVAGATGRRKRVLAPGITVAQLLDRLGLEP